MNHNYDPTCCCVDCCDYEYTIKHQIQSERKPKEMVPVSPDLQLELVIPSNNGKKNKV